MATLLKQKPKAETKTVEADFDIPDFRTDKRYIEAVSKRDYLKDRLQTIEKEIEAIRTAEKIENGVDYQAKLLLSGENSEVSPHLKLDRLYQDRRILTKAVELQERVVDQLRLSICSEIGKNPKLVEHVSSIFRRTGAAMELLKECLITETAVLQKLRGAGINERIRGEWHEHRIFDGFNRHFLTNQNNPLNEYIRWNTTHFGAK